MRQGDFTELASHYAKSRPDYSETMLSALVGLHRKPVAQIRCVDVGAGTGIWTRQVAGLGVPMTAVEPNDAMRREGLALNGSYSIEWIKGSGEETTLPDSCVDWVTMASSFHWVNFDAGVREFARILKPGGYFTALWNPRLIEVSPMFVEIEEHLRHLVPSLKRVSSGVSEFTETLSDRLWACGHFDDVVYIEARHVIPMTPERYLSAWRSVNDIQAQAGPEVFQQFMSYVENRIAGLSAIETVYRNRSWSARKRQGAVKLSSV